MAGRLLFRPFPLQTPQQPDHPGTPDPPSPRRRFFPSPFRPVALPPFRPSAPSPRRPVALPCRAVPCRAAVPRFVAAAAGNPTQPDHRTERLMAVSVSSTSFQTHSRSEKTSSRLRLRRRHHRRRSIPQCPATPTPASRPDAGLRRFGRTLPPSGNSVSSLLPPAPCRHPRTFPNRPRPPQTVRRLQHLPRGVIGNTADFGSAFPGSSPGGVIGSILPRLCGKSLGSKGFGVPSLLTAAAFWWTAVDPFWSRKGAGECKLGCKLTRPVRDAVRPYRSLAGLAAPARQRSQAATRPRRLDRGSKAGCRCCSSASGRSAAPASARSPTACPHGRDSYELAAQSVKVEDAAGFVGVGDVDGGQIEANHRGAAQREYRPFPI